MAMTRQESGKQFLPSRGEGTTITQSATWVAALGLLLLMTTVSAMSQTLSTPGNDQAGGVSTFPILKAMPVEPEPDSGSVNADPAGRYDWSTSYDFHRALPSHDSRIQGNLTAEAKFLDMAPIETSLPYLTVASNGAEHEFSSTYGSGSYDWNDFSEFNAKVAYAKSKIAAVRDAGVTGKESDETPSADESYHKLGTDTTGFSMSNK